MRIIGWLCAAVWAALLCVGCGGGGSGAPQQPESASLLLRAEWPARGRALPSGANCVRVEVYSGQTLLAERLLERPQTGVETSAYIAPVPVGILTIDATAYPEPGGGGVAQGTGRMTVTTRNGEQAVVNVSLNSTIVSLAVSPSAASLQVGEARAATATPRDAAGNAVLVAPGSIGWTSSNPSVATVDGAGVVTGVGAGTATITARERESGISGALTVTVTAAPPATGGRIAFLSTRDGAPELYIMDADGSNQTRLTFDGAAKDEIAISPDGRRIAFISNQTGRWNIYAINTDGSGLRQLTDNGRANWRPSYSADGQRIVFFSSYESDEICVMNADGSGETRLTTNGAADVLPVFTPDGRIIFSSDRDGRYYLYVMNADGSNQVRLTTGAEQELYHDVSRTDGRVVFTHGGWFSVTSTGGGTFAYVDSGRIALFDGSAIIPLASGGSSDKPVFSPDGRNIAFSTNRDGQWEIYTISADGANLTRLTTSPGVDWYPAWGPG